MDVFYQKIDELLEKYIGGQIFFTELDKAVKFDREILLKLKAFVDNDISRAKLNAVTIASGEIGCALHNFGIPVDIIVPGGLRHDPSRINLTPFKDKLANKHVIFIDDSYFSGRTAQVIKEEVKRCGGYYAGAYVAYDGSKHKEDKVYSLYRYYDHHDILGRPIKPF